VFLDEIKECAMRYCSFENKYFFTFIILFTLSYMSFSYPFVRSYRPGAYVVMCTKKKEEEEEEEEKGN
jgi:hypothetical protein